MPLFNTKEQFGSIIKVLHWSIFILVLMQYAIMTGRSFLPEDAPQNISYILFHKSIGLIILGVAALMLASRFVGTQPPLPQDRPLQNLVAKIVHIGLYACLILMPIGGILMTIFSGRPLALFGYPLTSANFVPVNEPLADFSHAAHIWAARILLGLILLHTLGALYHHFILKDTILKRMWFTKIKDKP